MNKVTKKDLYNLYIVQGLPMWEVANSLNVAVGTVYNYIKLYEIESRPPHKGFKGKTHTKEAREKISLAHKGKVVSIETRKKLKEAQKLKTSGHRKKRKDGYISVYFPAHPKANKDGYIPEHHLIMESHIGRHLKEDEVVHHINHVRDDNRIENLQLMTFKEHSALHMKERWAQKKGASLSIK